MNFPDNEPADAAEDEIEEPDKLGIQVELIRGSLAEEGIEIGIAYLANGDLDFMYQEGVILVQDDYLDQVRYLLRRGDRDVPAKALEVAADDGGRLGTVEGITLYSLNGTDYRDRTLAAVELIDRVLGTGVATPNHILSITAPVWPCPATEPDGVPHGAQPDPGVCDQGGGGVSVYVPDTGLIKEAADDHQWQAGHPWLAGVTGAQDKAVRNGRIHEYGCHGTFVAGVIRCMAPSARVHVASDFTKAGAVSEFDLVRELNRALGEGINIISLSAGCTTRLNLPLLSFTGFWRRYISYKGVLLVAAAGNNSTNRPFWPAAFPQVVGVGALSKDRRGRAWFSDYGPSVDVYAPGEDLVNAFAVGWYKYREPPRIGQEHKFHGMARWSGTSFATPLVAGLVAARMTATGESAPVAAAALLAAARRQQIPGLGPVLLPCDTGDCGCQAQAPCVCGCAGHCH
jgi:Subtilase family